MTNFYNARCILLKELITSLTASLVLWIPSITHTHTHFEEYLKQWHSANHRALTDNQQDEPSPLQLSTVHYKLHLPLAIITLTQAWRTVAIATQEILCNQTCPAARLQYMGASQRLPSRHHLQKWMLWGFAKTGENMH